MSSRYGAGLKPSADKRRPLKGRSPTWRWRTQTTEISIAPALDDRLTVRLDSSDRAALERRAKRIGVGPSTLARIWLKERLRQEVERENHGEE